MGRSQWGDVLIFIKYSLTEEKHFMRTMILTRINIIMPCINEFVVLAFKFSLQSSFWIAIILVSFSIFVWSTFKVSWSRGDQYPNGYIRSQSFLSIQDGGKKEASYGRCPAKKAFTWCSFFLQSANLQRSLKLFKVLLHPEIILLYQATLWLVSVRAWATHEDKILGREDLKYWY